MLAVTVDPRKRALVALCGYAGLRVAESLTITPASFDLDEMTLTVRGKGDKTRIIPVSTRCWTHVAAAYVKATLIADYCPLVGYKDRFAREIITNLAAKADLMRAVSSHDLRATFATDLYSKCKDLRVTQELLGHSSSATTETYTGIHMNTMREALEL